MTHPALEESELYDDPPQATANVSVLHGVAETSSAAAASQDTRNEAPQKSARYMEAVSAALDILSYRLILLLSVLVAGGLFGLATWYPDPWRLGAASAFAVIVVVPLTFFYARRQ